MLQNADIKQALKEAGFEIYRVTKGGVHLAERVRENLIMDARIKVQTTHVSFSTRARGGDFPEEAREDLFARARSLGTNAVANGYTESSSFVTDLPDPSDPSRTLDTWYEVEFAKPVSDMAGAIDEARFVLKQVRKASRS